MSLTLDVAVALGSLVLAMTLSLELILIATTSLLESCSPNSTYLPPCEPNNVIFKLDELSSCAVTLSFVTPPISIDFSFPVLSVYLCKNWILKSLVSGVSPSFGSFTDISPLLTILTSSTTVLWVIVTFRVATVFPADVNVIV